MKESISVIICCYNNAFVNFVSDFGKILKSNKNDISSFIFDFQTCRNHQKGI